MDEREKHMGVSHIEGSLNKKDGIEKYGKFNIKFSVSCNETNIIVN
jgi:hypothetical protein